MSSWVVVVGSVLLEKMGLHKTRVWIMPLLRRGWQYV